MSRGFSAALLAGGRSTRMGEDKAFLSFGDPPMPLWERQLRTLRKLWPDQLLLSQNADQDFGSPQGVETVVDVRGDCGPLGGLISCLRRATSPRVLVLAVDLPYVTADFLETLLAAPGGVVLQDPTCGRFEPVAAVYTHACLEIADDHLRRGDLAMRACIETCVERGHLVPRAITDDERPLLRNLNRPEDLDPPRFFNPAE